MKTKILTVLVSVLIGLSLNVLADGHEGDNGGDQPGQNEGGLIRGK